MATPKNVNTSIEHFGFIRATAVAPRVAIGDVSANTETILKHIKMAAENKSSIVVFPEMSITGYTLGDLFHQDILQKKALDGLEKIKNFTKGLSTIAIVGLPVCLEGKLFNAAAVVGNGKIWGLIPKTYIPGYKEFYEERWFSSSRDLINKEIFLFGKKIPIGSDLLFRSIKNPDLVFGVEICEDVWMPLPPSSFQALAGAIIMCNLSASNELVGKADYRNSLVIQQSARTVSGYIYASCGVHESTTDVVFSGHSILAENGKLLNESRRFERDDQITYADFDLEHLKEDRIKMTSFGEGMHEIPKTNFRFIDMDVSLPKIKNLTRKINPYPFIPSDQENRNKVCQEIFNIQAAGLAKRLEHSGVKTLILGISGGLDSTLALLVAMRTFEILNLSPKNIRVFTLPGFGTTPRTKSNAIKLAKILGLPIEEVNIKNGCVQQLKDLKHDGKTQDVTFENVQARYRTMVLMNKANQLKGIVLGTGDLSEIALGWCTFTGDQISHYHVNAGVPKTLVRYIIEWVSEQKDFTGAKKILRDILATPVSPELIRNHKKEITQKTEEIIGPYELHDFFLYHFVRWGSSPKKILFLAKEAFNKKYRDTEIKKWLLVFLHRFFTNQWKRSVMPDGPKVGSVALSPRGDWRMPSDADMRLWIKELN